MPKLQVNVDSYMFTVDNPIAGQPPLARHAARGDVIEVSSDEAKRGRETLVNVDYEVGKGQYVRAQEPALVPVGDRAQSGLDAAKAARREALRSELAALGDDEADDAPSPVVGRLAGDPTKTGAK